MTTTSQLVAALTDRIAAALAIHRPCHTAATEPWACPRAHYGLWGYHGSTPGRHQTGIPDPTQPAVCVSCSHTYPCPTAQALGVPAPEPTTTQET
ncbi:MAG TPA: hypothetical protein VLL08_04200 [Kineosporiaceae bacterium]|nr:hypothetical protein [Kineosporiaceae bacterium]